MNKESYILIMDALVSAYDRLMTGSNTEDELEAVREALVQLAVIGFTE